VYYLLTKISLVSILTNTYIAIGMINSNRTEGSCCSYVKKKQIAVLWVKKYVLFSLCINILYDLYAINSKIVLGYF